MKPADCSHCGGKMTLRPAAGNMTPDMFPTIIHPQNSILCVQCGRGLDFFAHPPKLFDLMLDRKGTGPPEKDKKSGFSALAESMTTMTEAAKESTVSLEGILAAFETIKDTIVPRVVVKPPTGIDGKPLVFNPEMIKPDPTGTTADKADFTYQTQTYYPPPLPVSAAGFVKIDTAPEPTDPAEIERQEAKKKGRVRRTLDV